MSYDDVLDLIHQPLKSLAADRVSCILNVGCFLGFSAYSK